MTDNFSELQQRFYCELCDFKCCKKGDWSRHVLTNKHKKVTFSDKNTSSTSTNICKNCLKSYKSRNGLWLHKKKCNADVDTISSNKNTSQDLINMFMEVIKQNQELINQNNETQKKNEELTNKLFKLYNKSDIQNTPTTNNIINSNNKTFNLNLFLNNECKDAMNITDFVDSVKLQISDLENVGKLGYIEGISNIIIKNLKALDVHKRPLHCSDPKREIMYIKDENKWEKENEEKMKMRKVIKKIANKNIKVLSQFKQEYPDCGKSESKYSDKYNNLIIEAMGGKEGDDIDKEDKIIKNIAKEVIIDK